MFSTEFPRWDRVFARLGIPMMSITQSDLMPISAERSDAGLSQCERVIGMSQDVL
jgi:hypothetical protein